MEPSSPAKRTFHLLRPPDISSANDNRLLGSYHSVTADQPPRIPKCQTKDDRKLTSPTPRMIANKIFEVEIGRCKQSSITVTALRTHSNYRRSQNPLPLKARS